jgi:hypothetical protein
MAPNYALDVTGQARFSSNVSVGTNNPINTSITLAAGQTFNSAAQVEGLDVNTNNTGIGQNIGLNVLTNNGGTGNGDLTAIQVRVRELGAVTVTSNGIGLLINGPDAAAGGTITNVYGLKIQSQKGTGVTNAYGIYEAGANDLNYFAGQTGIGGAPSNGALTIGTNTAAASGGLYFGTDTDLYRSGVNTLKTDGQFRSVGDLISNAGGANQVWIGAIGQPGIWFGNASDTNLYRIGANALATDSTLQVGTTGSGTLSVGSATGGLQINQGGAAAGIRNLNQTAGAASLSISAGAGASQIRFNSNTGDGTGGVLFYSGGASPAVVLQADNTGKLLWGSSADTNLYRCAANCLRTDGTFQTGGSISAGGNLSVNTSGSGGSIFFNPAGDVSLTSTVAGNLTVQHTTDSSNGFVVKNSGSTSVLAADTTNLGVNVTNLQSSGTISLQGPDGGSILLRTAVNSGTGSNAIAFSGNEITDTKRAANTQGDGRAAPDSSTGIWESTTNLVTNGGFESNTTGWGADFYPSISKRLVEIKVWLSFTKSPS